MNFLLMLNAVEEKTFPAEQIQFSCGDEEAWCADRVSSSFGADLTVKVTATKPTLKGTFDGTIVLCGNSNPPKKEITKGKFLILNEDILNL